MKRGSEKKKFLSLGRLLPILRRLKSRGKRIVFTNGCFDILHPGHVHLLKRASRLGDILVVALNTDSSVRKLKGPGRPIFPLRERAEILSSLECVDFVVPFREETPARIIESIVPHILVKGGDWKLSAIVGRDTVTREGGRVVNISLKKGKSTTVLIERIINRFGHEG